MYISWPLNPRIVDFVSFSAKLTNTVQVGRPVVLTLRFESNKYLVPQGGLLAS
jgi:hypothetical protein